MQLSRFRTDLLGVGKNPEKAAGSRSRLAISATMNPLAESPALVTTDGENSADGAATCSESSLTVINVFAPVTYVVT